MRPLESRMSEAAEARLNEIIARYPQPKSAVMSALYMAQEEFGVLDNRAVSWISGKLDIAPVHVWELISFYSMYHSRPVGRYHFQVCRTLSCAARGSKALVEYLKKRFGIKTGEVSADGLWSFEEVECLGACGGAPVCEVNDLYVENLDEEKLAAFVDRVSKERPDLSFSTVKDRPGDGFVKWQNTPR